MKFRRGHVRIVAIKVPYNICQETKTPYNSCQKKQAPSFYFFIFL